MQISKCFPSATILIVLAMVAYPTHPSVVNPFLGTWILDVEESTFEPGPPLRSETWSAAAATDGQTHFVDSWVESDGTKGQVEFTIGFDGRPAAVTGSAEFDSTIYKKIDGRSYRSSLLKNGIIIERELHVVSPDGNSWHATERGKDSQGTPYTYHLVFKRQPTATP